MVLNSIKRFITPDSVFFCHSISCAFLVKYCIKNNIKIGKAILVSGFEHLLGLDDDFDDVNCTMYTNSVNKFIDLCSTRICYYSNNDPYVPQSYLTNFANSLKATTICVKNAGHFNTSSGYNKFPELLKYIN